jgi:hypothetical protein
VAGATGVAGVAVLVPLSCARRVAIIESFSRSMPVRAALVVVIVDRRSLSVVDDIARFAKASALSLSKDSDCVIGAIMYALLAPW